MKIVFLGDSLTWGGYGGSFIAEIKKLLPDHEIINAGVDGNTVVNLLERLGDDVLTHEPDGVFVMVGGNDSISYSQPETRPYYKQAQNIPDGVVTPDLFARTYRNLLQRLQIEHIQTWVGLPPGEYNPETAEALQEFNALAAEIARSMNIPTLDLMAHFVPNPGEIPKRKPANIGSINTIGKRSSSGWDEYENEKESGGFTFTFDGLHLTPEAAKQVAEVMANFLGLDGNS
jgi:lysophospholipase L1-like esterase